MGVRPAHAKSHLRCLYRQQHGTGNQGFRSFGVWNLQYAISTSMVLKNGLALPLFREVQGLVCLRIRPGAPEVSLGL